MGLSAGPDFGYIPPYPSAGFTGLTLARRTVTKEDGKIRQATVMKIIDK